jgi:acyl-CoA thioesterase
VIEHGFASIATRLEQRWALPSEGPVAADGPARIGPGRTALWTRMPALLEPSVAALAVLGDFVPMGIGAALDRRLTVNSLDNTLRVFEVRPTEWFLVDVQISRVRNGFGHGTARIYDDTGVLLAEGSQSATIRAVGQ